MYNEFKGKSISATAITDNFTFFTIHFTYFTGDQFPLDVVS